MLGNSLVSHSLSFFFSDMFSLSMKGFLLLGERPMMEMCELCHPR